MTFLFYTLMVLFIIVSLFLILLVLIQKGRGGGLASAFGGMGGNTAFGSKTGDVLTWATSVIFGVFLLLAIALNLIANSRHNASLRAGGGLVGGGAADTTSPPAAPPVGGGSMPIAPGSPGPSGAPVSVPPQQP